MSVHTQDSTVFDELTFLNEAYIYIYFHAIIMHSQGGGVVNTFACYKKACQRMPSGRAGSNPVLDALLFFFFLKSFSIFPQ